MSSNVGFIQHQTLSEIASAIRVKDASASNEMLPSEMAQAILDIPTGSGGNTLVPRFLKHSDLFDILVNTYYTEYNSETPSWGGLTVTGTPTLEPRGITVANGQGFSYQLTESNHNVTVYAIVFSRVGDSALVMSVGTKETTGYCPNINAKTDKWRKSNWTDTTINESNYHNVSVLTMSIDVGNRVANFYIDGISQGTVTIYESSNIVRFNGSTSHNSYTGGFTYLYVGIVDGCEDSETILANQADMVQFLQKARVVEQTDGSSISSNILFGVETPTSDIGNDGDLYIKTHAYTKDFTCDPEYLVISTTQRLATHSVAFYKTVEGPAIAVHYYNSDGFYGPLLVSTNPEYVKHTTSTGNPWGSAIIDGTTWYLSKPNYWNQNQDSPTIPTMYDVPEWYYDENAVSGLISEILSRSHAHILEEEETDYKIDEIYVKVKSMWILASSRSISDVNLSGSSNEDGFENIVSSITNSIANYDEQQF